MASRELNILIKAKNLAGAVLGQVKGDLNGLGRIGSKAGRNLAANFERGVIAAGAGVGAFTALTIKTAMSFEDAFAGVLKTVDELELAQAGLTFDDLMGDFRAMAREMPIAFEELAAIGEAAGALGIAAGDIDEFTEVVAKLGVTTDLTSDEAATALGHLGTILGLTGDDFEELADSLVALGNDGASTESQIIDIAERFAAAGNAAGLTKEEILALSSTAASMGIDAEAAGGSLSRLFNNTATNIGTSSKKAKELADALGMTFDDFKEAWRTDALGTFQSLLDHLNDLDQFESAELLKKLGITNTRDINAIQLLSGGVEELNDQLETSRTAQGALGEEAAKKFATTASQVERFKNVLRDAGYVVGKELLPIVNDLLTDFTNFMAQDSTQQKIKDFAKDFAQHVRDAADWLKSIDWDKVGSALSTAAGFAKGLLDAFVNAPSWVQTAVLTGWGLNKLTGGAVGDLFGHLASGLIKGILGINAGVVNVRGAVVNAPGGGGPVGGGKGGGKIPGLPFGVGAAAAILLPTMIGGSENPAAAPGYAQQQELTAAWEAGLITDEEYQRAWVAAYNEATGGTVNTRDAESVSALIDNRRAIERSEAATRDAIPWLQRNREEVQNLNMSEGRRWGSSLSELQQQRALQATQASRLAAIEGIEAGNSGKLAQIRDRKTSFTALINTTVNVSLQEWQRKHVSSLRAASNSGGFI